MLLEEIQFVSWDFPSVVMVIIMEIREEYKLLVSI